jgi:hypothetical protein
MIDTGVLLTTKDQSENTRQIILDHHKYYHKFDEIDEKDIYKIFAEEDNGITTFTVIKLIPYEFVDQDNFIEIDNVKYSARTKEYTYKGKVSICWKKSDLKYNFYSGQLI